ncbi:hypothetical protein AB6T38_16610 [Aliiglaciecola sp. SL4]|uniref:hypothetical protein n=1 Tax=Aliiglaciecola sp. SL4 TaxID=3239806 RepID=UPI00355AE2C8
MKTPLVLSLGAVLIFVVGYWFGALQAESNGNQLQTDGITKKVIIEIDGDSSKSSIDANKINAIQAKPENLEIQAETYSSAASTQQSWLQQQAKELAELGEAFQHSKLTRQQQQTKETEFEKGYTVNKANLTAQNQISDFLALHQEADLINLHRLDCDDSRCQMIGEYAGEHQN